MILQIYGVKDNVEGGYVFFFQAGNEGLMKRVVKGALLSKEPNVFTSNMKDKSIFNLGEVDTDTGFIKPISPLYCVNISEIRLELIREIKIAKQEAGDAEPKADEVASDE